MEHRMRNLMTYSEVIKCARCGRVMLIIKGTFLCPICNMAEIYDLQTPWTRQEEKDWVDRNLGVSKDGK
jgi:uncharacterized Zn finger protein (UPF0148 family)